ncbi:hypothetical protein [Ketobacter sp.]|uniref:hypothetical protein n=1 Tax=Ketobacter sp. TaxID=2083498 RepID=UPI0025BE29D3|nr:hypothetical protein [Ketobacter sp.]
MKYIIGSLIISFGIIFVVMVISMAVHFKAPDNALAYLGGTWLVLGILCYPLARKWIR